MKTDIELCNVYAVKLDNGFYTVKLDGFSEACYNQNSEQELRGALALRAADKSDCENWEITPTQWRQSIERALAAKIVANNADKIPG